MIENVIATKSDSLSVVLMKMKLRAFVDVTLDAGGEGNWAIDFPGSEGLSFNVVQKGECWLSGAGGGSRKSVHLRTGDAFLMTGAKPFTIAKSASTKKRKRYRAEQLFARARDGVVTCQSGGDVVIVGNLFRFEGHLPAIVLGRLPPLIHIASDSDQAAVLRWSLDRFGAELRGAGVGRSLMLNHLAPIMLLQTLRIYLQSATNEDNWLVALSDARLSNVLEAMHMKYAHAWSLDELADVARMSRSGLALVFKKKVGVAPMEYLTHWRMQVACELLRGGDESVAQVAGAVGYASESAFSVAFRKIVKCRPGVYRTQSLVD